MTEDVIPTKKTNDFSRRMLVRVAAAGIAIAAGAGAWFYTAHRQVADPMRMGEVKMVMVEVPDTLKRYERTKLADGSSILISPGSSVSYAEDFSSNRKVEMAGQAYFDVERDSLHAFTVATDNLKVRVLGTKFNVDAYPGRPFTTVTLYRGCLAIESAGTSDRPAITLMPGYRFVYHNDTGEYCIEKTSDLLPEWITGRLRFFDTSLGDILSAVEWYYGVEIKAHDHVDLTESYTFRLTGQKDIGETMSLIKEVSRKIDYAIDGKTIRITAKNKQLTN